MNFIQAITQEEVWPMWNKAWHGRGGGAVKWPKRSRIFFGKGTCPETNIYFSYWKINQYVLVFQSRGAIQIAQLEKCTLEYFQMEDVTLIAKAIFFALWYYIFSFNKFTCFRAITFCHTWQSVLVCIKIPVHLLLFEIPWHIVIWGLGEKGSWVTEWQIEIFDNLRAGFVPIGIWCQ